MIAGDVIQIDGQAFDVLRQDGPDRWYVGGPGRRRVLLWRDRGVFRYGRTGRVVTVEGPLADVRMERITATMGDD